MEPPATPACSHRRRVASGGTSTSTAPCWWRRWTVTRQRSSSDAMRRPQQVIAEQARKVASEMPPSLVETLAEAIEQSGDGWVAGKGAILASLSHPQYRSFAAELLGAWEAEAATVAPAAVAMALL